MKDNGREEAPALAAVLNPRGYAVAGVSIRSSGQAKFPGQLQDIKAAIRWLRAHGDKYHLDPDHIGIVGDSSGGWTAAMAALTSGEPKLEGSEGNTGVSSAVQAAVVFYPVTDFSLLDRWALYPCRKEAKGFALGYCHDVPGSPESLLLGCVPSKCPKKSALANPIRHVGASPPPFLIIHGGNDQMVSHVEGEALYQALSKACDDAAFVSLPLAEHGGWNLMLTDPALQYGATIRSTARRGCEVSVARPVTPSWNLLIDFLDKHLKAR